MNGLLLGLLLLGGGISPRQLQMEIDKIVAQPQFEGAVWGVLIQAPARGYKTLYTHNATVNFRPASNLKILTTILAMDRLGPDYRFETTLSHTGHIDENGVLHGDLIVTGGGDPSLSHYYGPSRPTTDEILGVLIEALQTRGVTRVNGRLLGDVSFFDDVDIQRSWEWDDVGSYYTVPVSPLALANGWVHFEMETDAQGVLTFGLQPEATPDLNVSLAVTSDPGDRDINVGRPWGGNQFALTGNLPPCARSRFRRAVWDTGKQFLAVFADAMRAAAIPINGSHELVHSPPPDQVPLEIFTSEDLAVVAQVLMKDSQNHYADLFLKTTARHYTGEGSFEAGAALAGQLLAEISSDPRGGFGQHIRDGSGLSAQNYLKPLQVSALLQHGLEASWRDAWLKTMPAMGIDGTTRYRGNDGVQGRVWAKTGYIYRSRCLSGYVETEAGEPLTFSLLVNNYQCRTREVELAQDQICAALRRLKPNRAYKRNKDMHFLLSSILDP